MAEFRTGGRVITLGEGALREGRGFETGHRFDAAGSGADVEFIISNPGASGVLVNLESILLATDGEARFVLYEDSTIDVAGTPLTPANRRVGNARTSLANIEHGGTYSPGTERARGLVPPNLGLVTIGGAVGVTQVIIEAAHNLHVIMTNQAGPAADLAFLLAWWEA